MTLSRADTTKKAAHAILGTWSLIRKYYYGRADRCPECFMRLDWPHQPECPSDRKSVV